MIVYIVCAILSFIFGIAFVKLCDGDVRRLDVMIFVVLAIVPLLNIMVAFLMFASCLVMTFVVLYRYFVEKYDIDMEKRVW